MIRSLGCSSGALARSELTYRGYPIPARIGTAKLRQLLPDSQLDHVAVETLFPLLFWKMSATRVEPEAAASRRGALPAVAVPPGFHLNGL
jgi:hypothetical protein